MQAVEKHHSMLLKAMNHGTPQEIVNDLFVKVIQKAEHNYHGFSSQQTN